MKRLFSILAGGLLLSTTLTASAAGDRTPSSTSPPIITWQAPAFYTSPPSGRTALTDAAPPMPFIPLVPCRQYDSRSPSSPLPDNTARTVTLSGAPCGIPTTAKAVAVNITVFNISGAGSNGVFKVGTSAPPPTSWINYPSTETQRANAGVLPTTSTGAIVVQVNQGAGSVGFIVDVFGYYGPTPANTGNTFTVINPTNTTAILGQSLGGGIGVYGHSLGAGGRGVFGYNNSASGFGVQGTSGPGIGVQGTSTSNVGVKGISSSYNGVWAETTGAWDALFASGGRDGAYVQGARNGVIGVSTGTTGKLYGVLGVSSSTSAEAAGVEGHDSFGVAYTGGGLNGTAGVYGWGRSGVAGVTSAAGQWGVIGMKLISPTSLGAFGVLGYGLYGVYSFGNTGASGTKSFVEPHPTDASKVIRYVSLEGNESGTYFRGTAHIVNGEAVIAVPESFKIVTDEEGLTVQVTPVGAAAVVWVASQDLDQIVLRSAKDVTVHYLAQGFRRAYKDWEVIADGQEYRPNSPDQKIPDFLSAEVKRRLIQNGTYNPDGTVNMATAERMGWAKAWKEEAVAAAVAPARK